MSYILKLAGWYPSKIDLFNGDFVQRHAQSIALYEDVIVIYVVKSTLHSEIEIEKNTNGRLTEYIGYYPARNIADKMFSIFFYLRLAKRIIKKIFLEKGTPRLVHVNIVWKAGLAALFLKRKYGLPFVITENWTGYYKKDNGYLKRNSLKFFLHKKVFKNASLFLPVTENLALTCNRLFHLKLPFFVIENAVNTKIFYEENNRNTMFQFVHISTMGYQKNIYGLIKVLKKLSEERADFELTLVGPCDKLLQEEINAHMALSAITTITGNITYEKVATRVRKADALILFSRYENLPCVILECLCAGVPIISTDVGGIKEVINENNGIIIKSEDEVALYNALEKMIDQHHLFDKKLIAADASKTYSFEAIGVKYIHAYNKLKTDN